MRITSKGRYGLRAMMELARSTQNGQLLKVREISERQSIPLKYLEQIINTLKKSRLVASARGADGGYRIARPSDEITVFEILSALEGDLTIIDRNDPPGKDQGLFWIELEDKIKSMLDIPLADFIASSTNKATDEGLMFYI